MSWILNPITNMAYLSRVRVPLVLPFCPKSTPSEIPLYHLNTGNVTPKVTPIALTLFPYNKKYRNTLLPDRPTVSNNNGYHSCWEQFRNRHGKIGTPQERKRSFLHLRIPWPYQNENLSNRILCNRIPEPTCLPCGKIFPRPIHRQDVPWWFYREYRGYS